MGNEKIQGTGDPGRGNSVYKGPGMPAVPTAPCQPVRGGQGGRSHRRAVPPRGQCRPRSGTQSEQRGVGLPAGSEGTRRPGRRASPQLLLPCVTLSVSPTLSELPSSVRCSEARRDLSPAVAAAIIFMPTDPALGGTLGGASGTINGTESPLDRRSMGPVLLAMGSLDALRVLPTLPCLGPPVTMTGDSVEAQGGPQWWPL